MDDQELVKQAFLGIYPNKLYTYNAEVTYNNRLKGYRANMWKRYNTIHVTMNPQWKDVDPDIKIGLIQHLMMKIFKTKKSTINTEFYDTFIKKLHLVIEKTENEPFLEESFNRVNEKYFYGTMLPTNLKFGRRSTTTLGSYSYTTDTITISTIFKEGPEDLLDYLMYHEMLHKKMQFKTTNNRSLHHSKRFKEKEREFNNSKEMEKRLSEFAATKRRRRTKTQTVKRKRKFSWF